jgi:putative transposase
MSAKRSGGTGFQPVSFFKITRRNLPHWQESERVYFITWRCKKDHIHALAQPLIQSESGTFDLGEIIHSVKSFSAHKINKKRGEKGSIWQDERYDRIVRDEAEFVEKWQYIRTNPVKNGLSQNPEDYPWLYEKR